MVNDDSDGGARAAFYRRSKPSASGCHRLKMLPEREVELLAHLSPFSAWEVAGGFDEREREITDGESTQVWRYQKSVC